MREVFCLVPFRRRQGELKPQDRFVCEDEDQLFRRGRVAAAVHDGVAFFKIECTEDGDTWEPVEVLTTVGDVPAEDAA